MRLDADDDEGQFPRPPAASSAGDAGLQQAADERPVSQDTDSTEAETHTALTASRELDE